MGNRARSDRCLQPCDVPKDMRAVAKKAIAQGWQITRRNGGHLMWHPPDKEQRLLISPATPSEARGIRNAIKALERAGLVL